MFFHIIKEALKREWRELDLTYRYITEANLYLHAHGYLATIMMVLLSGWYAIVAYLLSLDPFNLFSVLVNICVVNIIGFFYESLQGELGTSGSKQDLWLNLYGSIVGACIVITCWALSMRFL